MKERVMRAITGDFAKILIAFVLIAAQADTATVETSGQAQNSPSVDLPSLVGKSLGDIIQELKKPRRCREINPKDFASLMPRSTIPSISIDDLCQFKVGGGRLNVFSYRGRAVAFMYILGPKAPSEPEEALLRVGINVNGAKPLLRHELGRNYIWAGEFNGISWKELGVVRTDLKDQKSSLVYAIASEAQR